MSLNVRNAPRSLVDCRLGVQAQPALERLREGTERVKTGFFELDRSLGGGIPVPTLGILGAKPKCGKSSILLQVVSHIVTHGGYAYLVDLENGIDRLLRRIMCSASGTDPSTLGASSFMPTDPWRKAEELVLSGALSQRLFVETERRFDAKFIEQRVAELKSVAEDKPFVVVLDSLQKLPMNLQDRRSGIDGWMRALEYIRDRHRAIIILASELKRPQQGQAYKPNEVSLKESGDIEYSADLVLTLDRQDDKNDEYVTDKPPTPATMRILFNRDGQTGRVADYRLVYPFHRVEEIARPEFEGLRRAHLAAVPSRASYLEADP